MPTTPDEPTHGLKKAQLVRECKWNAGLQGGKDQGSVHSMQNASASAIEPAKSSCRGTPSSEQGIPAQAHRRAVSSSGAQNTGVLSH
jgi:hypothetical protein